MVRVTIGSFGKVITKHPIFFVAQIFRLTYNYDIHNAKNNLGFFWGDEPAKNASGYCWGR